MSHVVWTKDVLLNINNRFQFHYQKDVTYPNMSGYCHHQKDVTYPNMSGYFHHPKDVTYPNMSGYFSVHNSE